MENIREEWEFNVMFEGFNWFNHQRWEDDMGMQLELVRNFTSISCVV